MWKTTPVNAPERDTTSQGFIPTREAFEKKLSQPDCLVFSCPSSFHILLLQATHCDFCNWGGGRPFLPLLQQPLCQFLPAGLFLMIDMALKTHLAVGSSKNSCLGTKQTTCSGARRQQSIAVKNEGAGADILPLPLF